jgi:hypothetical protein
MNFDQPARAYWSPVIDAAGRPLASGGERDFETLRDAVLFVMEKLAWLDQTAAFIQTDRVDGHYPIETIKQIYQSAEFNT